MPKNSPSSTAHSVLEYIISRVMMEGKTGETSVRLPIDEMIEEYGGKVEIPNAYGIILELTIKAELKHGTNDLEVTMDDYEDDDDV